jgi:putative transposase
MPHFRESPRLKHFDYMGAYAYFITIVTRQRRRAFLDSVLVASTLELLHRSLNRYGLNLHAYCCMPDHLHLLLSGDPAASLQDCMRHFKQLSSFDYKKRSGSELWQTSYYDRVLRSDEDLPSVARYIWGNPVTAGLVQRAEDCQFSGPRPLPEA